MRVKLAALARSVLNENGECDLVGVNPRLVVADLPGRVPIGVLIQLSIDDALERGITYQADIAIRDLRNGKLAWHYRFDLGVALHCVQMNLFTRSLPARIQRSGHYQFEFAINAPREEPMVRLPFEVVAG
jgi:hypothetical protein